MSEEVTAKRVCNLARSYLSAAETCLSRFEQTFGRRDALRAWKSGAIGQRGPLLPAGTYEMHGTGCTVVLEHRVIELEFAGPGVVGFDAWRLWQYARQAESPGWNDLFDIERALRIAMDNNLVVALARPEFAADGNGSLFELVEV